MSPTAAPRACLHPGCTGYAVRHGRCDAHAKPIDRAKWARPRTEAGRSWYFTSTWARLRLHVLAHEPLCRVCQSVGIIRPATDVDHITPHRGRSGLFWDRSNLQPLCKQCHGMKTGRERIEAARS